jgi:hypothetical protein
MTVGDIISRARNRYPGMSSALALQLFNDVHREVSKRTQLRNDQVNVDVVEGQDTYDIDTRLINYIREVYYAWGADRASRMELLPRSLDEYEVFRRNWRASLTESQPTEYYLSSAPDGNTSTGQIGLFQIPELTTQIDGYPRIEIFVSTVVDLEVGDDMPPQVQSELVYIYGIFVRYLAERQGTNLQELQTWISMYQKELQTSVVQSKDLQGNNADFQLVPAFTIGMRRVV